MRVKGDEGESIEAVCDCCYSAIYCWSQEVYPEKLELAMNQAQWLIVDFSLTEDDLECMEAGNHPPVKVSKAHNFYSYCIPIPVSVWNITCHYNFKSNVRNDRKLGAPSSHIW